MTWLLWKEYRLQRLILFVGLLLLVLPYAVSFYVHARSGNVTDWWLHLASLSSMILSIITLALLGGNAIAAERADRSAEFLAYQPIGRWSLLLGKLAWPALAATVLWSVNLVVYYRIAPTHSRDLQDLLGQDWIPVQMLFGLVAFSVAWLVSALQNSPTFAVGAGMAAPIATLLFAALICWVVWFVGGQPADHWATDLFVMLNLAIAPLSFTAGTWCFLRRVEP